jgi:hypothetical protein
VVSQQGVGWYEQQIGAASDQFGIDRGERHDGLRQLRSRFIKLINP